MNDSVKPIATAETPVTTTTVFAEPAKAAGSAWDVLNAQSTSHPVALTTPAYVDQLPTDGGFTRLQILDHPDVPVQAAKIIQDWGNLSGRPSSLDIIRFGTGVEGEIDRFYATMGAQAGKMEAHVFLTIANELMDGAEGQDSNLAKIEKEAEEQFSRPILVKLVALISEGWAKKMERKRLPQAIALIQSQFKSGGERVNSWIDSVRTRVEDACRAQIEGIKRWEIAIAEGRKHEIQLAATMLAAYQIHDLAVAHLATTPEMDRKAQQDKINVLKERMVFLGRLYADAPGRAVRSYIGLNGAVTTLTTVMSSASSFFIQLRQSSFDLTQGYQTRALQRANADLGNTAAALQRRGAQVINEVAIASVGMSANAAKQQAELTKTLASMTQKMVNDLKTAGEAAKSQLAEASKELAEGQRMMLDLRREQNMAG